MTRLLTPPKNKLRPLAARQRLDIACSALELTAYAADVSTQLSVHAEQFLIREKFFIRILTDVTRPRSA